MMTAGHREALKGREEFEVFTALRHIVPRYDRAGETKKIKKRFNRRIRRNLHQHINEDTVE